MGKKKKYKKEKEYYELIKENIEKIFKKKVNEIYLEITANKRFSERLKNEIPRGREIIFSFLKEAPPDIAGFVKKDYSSDFIVIEVKPEKIKLNDIYQLRKYRDLFDAKFAFLISLKPIPAEVKRLCELELTILSQPNWSHPKLTLLNFDEKRLQHLISGPEDLFKDWFPENPFEKDLYWK